MRWAAPPQSAPTSALNTGVNRTVPLTPLYSTSYFINGQIQREAFSPEDALRDVLQRPERESGR